MCPFTLKTSSALIADNITPVERRDIWEPRIQSAIPPFRRPKQNYHSNNALTFLLLKVTLTFNIHESSSLSNKTIHATVRFVQKTYVCIHVYIFAIIVIHSTMSDMLSPVGAFSTERLPCLLQLEPKGRWSKTTHLTDKTIQNKTYNKDRLKKKPRFH